MGADLTNLDRSLRRDGAKPVYLIQGEERLLVDEAQRRVLAAAVDDPNDNLAVTRLDFAESGVGAKEVIAACRSIGLFTARQAVIVRAAEIIEKRQDDRDLLQAYVEAPELSTTLIMVASKIRGNLGIVKRIKKYGEVLTFDRLKAWQVPDWIMAQSGRIGHRTDEGTARLVADLVGTDLNQLRLVMEQLSLYVGPGNPIRSEDAEALLSATRGHSVFELVDAVAERRAVAAMRHLHAMLENREPALRILAMLNRHFRMLWLASEARGRGASQDEIKSSLRLHSFVAKKLWNQSAKFDLRSLRRAYEALYETDRRLKSKGLDDHIVMEQLVGDLCRAT